MADRRPFEDYVTRMSTAEPAESTLLGGVSLGTRTLVFLLLGLVVILVLGFLLFEADRRADEVVSELESSQRLAGVVARIESGALTLVSNERDFVRTRDPRYAENYAKTSALMHEALDHMQSIDLPESLNNDLATIGDGVAEHAKQFEKVVETQKILGINDDTGLARLVRVSAPAEPCFAMEYGR